jgi:NADPH-dependent 2,4-dienoyl-CoA reductase/sulfur reductase-like enzyme
MAVGWLNPQVGEQALKDGKTDFICMGRRLIADPEIAEKASSGRLEDIRPCLGCNECMQSVARFLDPIRCSVNAAVGKERQYRIKPASRKKKVLVIGGGPAGMQAAIVAALRGHKVTLYEKNQDLGGSLTLAAMPPDKEPVAEFNNYLTSQVKKAGVDVRTGNEVTADFIIKSRPDAVVVSTGAVPSVPSIPGIDRPNVFKAGDILSGRVKAGKIVAIIGGGMVGCETGHFLASQGHNVSILEILGNMASDITVAAVKQRLLNGLTEKRTRLMNQVEVKSIGENGLTFINKDGNTDTIPADTIVIATGSIANPELFRLLKSMVPEIYQVGDAVQPARIAEAMESGLAAGFAV